tara:strand:+ start:194 stop:1216 length:1023 start_codon:yes stop_codon:yes gene_type:complete
MKTFQKERTVWDAFFLILKGVAMGAANKVPGVSGGIVALVGGFYEELIYSFQRLNFIALKLLFTGRIKSFWSYTNASFLSLLFGGVIVSYFSISLFLDYALTKNETVVMGAFLGMVLASLYLIIRQVPFWNKNLIAFLVLGFLLGLSLSIVKPISENDKLIFVFFCGIISVSGMTIPGLSGSFLLLILGNYNLLLVDAVNALFRFFSASLVMDFSLLDDPITSRLLLIMLVFAIGSVIGLVLFSNLIKLILDKYPNFTLVSIIGFILGTLRLVYPWKEKQYLFNDESEVITNSVGTPEILNYRYFLPDFSEFNTYVVILAFKLGVIILFLLDYYDKKRKT